MIRPHQLATERPHGPWSCRGTDIWDVLSAAALGDTDTLRLALARDPNLYRAEFWYTQPLHLAVREGRLGAVRILLEAGADPTSRGLSNEDLTTVARDRGHEPVAVLLEEARQRPPVRREAPPSDLERVSALGAALHEAARAGDRAQVELLLAQGADPNATVESSGSATYAAKTPDIRALLMEHGGTLDVFDLVFLDEDEEVLRRVEEDLREGRTDHATAGCGGVFTAVCKQGKRDLLVRLLAAGARVPDVVTGCRSYLMTDPETLRLLLESGMNPDLPNWQRATPLHDLCGRDGRGRAREHRVACANLLLDAGATITSRDEEYRSTPLAWATRSDLPEMVELLLDRGAPLQLPDDEPWATPLAWATRRGHVRIVELLRSRAQSPIS